MNKLALIAAITLSTCTAQPVYAAYESVPVPAAYDTVEYDRGTAILTRETATKINLDELIADREAGTDGPWRIVRYDAGDDRVPCNTPMIDGPEEYDAAVVHWDGFKQSYWSSAHGDERAIDANARRIARLPDLEAAYIEAVDILRDLADFKGGMWVLQDRAKDLFRS